MVKAAGKWQRPSPELYLLTKCNIGSRIDDHLVDLTARSGYRLADARPQNQYEWASEYFRFDWEYAQSPEVQAFLNTIEGLH